MIRRACRITVLFKQFLYNIRVSATKKGRYQPFSVLSVLILIMVISFYCRTFLSGERQASQHSSDTDATLLHDGDPTAEEGVEQVSITFMSTSLYEQQLAGRWYERKLLG